MSEITTVTSLISDIKDKAMAQNQSTSIGDQQIVDIANRKLRDVIAPWIMKHRERYFSATKDYTVSGKTRYRIPPDCIGGRIFDVLFYDGNRWFPLNYKNPGEISTRYGFTIDGGDIVLWAPNSNTALSGIMRVTYPCRPPAMAASGATSVTVTSVGSSSVTATGAGTGTFFIINSDNYMPIAPRVSFASNVGTNGDWIYGEDYTNWFSVGDIVVTSATTPYVPLTAEFREWLAEEVAMQMRKNWGHTEEVNMSMDTIKELKKSLEVALSPRVENEEKTIVDKETLGWRTW